MEELKIVVEALSGLGEGAKTAFIVWILAKYLLHYLTIMGVFSGFFFVLYKLVQPIAKQHSLVSQIKGVMGFNGELLKSEKKQVLDILRKAKGI